MKTTKLGLTSLQGCARTTASSTCIASFVAGGITECSMCETKVKEETTIGIMVFCCCCEPSFCFVISFDFEGAKGLKYGAPRLSMVTFHSYAIGNEVFQVCIVVETQEDS